MSKTGQGVWGLGFKASKKSIRLEVGGKEFTAKGGSWNESNQLRGPAYAEHFEVFIDLHGLFFPLHNLENFSEAFCQN
jgi:hypothetical protein